jgi:branched-chain amino acid transport system substrate-binding protein
MNWNVNRRDFLKVTGSAAIGAITGTTLDVNTVQAAALDKGYVLFGGSLALTGTYAKVAGLYKHAYEFYLDTVKHKIVVAGKEYPLQFKLYDDENDPTKTAQLTEKLINVDKADFILSAYGTDPVMAQCSICKKYNRVLINGGAATRRLEEEFSGTVFTLVPTGDFYHRTLIEMVGKLDPPLKTAGIIIPDDPIYHEIGKACKEQLEKVGIKIIVEDVIPMDTKELGSTVLKMQGKNIDMVINTGWDKLLASFVNEAIKYRLNLKFIDGGHATITPFLEESLGAKRRNICGVTFFLPESKTKDQYYGDSMNFNEKFKEKYGYNTAYHVAMAYLIPQIYENYLKSADSKDPFNTDNLRKYLFGLNQDTLWGKLRFNEKGRIIKDMLVIQFQDAPIQTVIVYPPENATGKLVYPSNPLGG